MFGQTHVRTLIPVQIGQRQQQQQQNFSFGNNTTDYLGLSQLNNNITRLNLNQGIGINDNDLGVQQQQQQPYRRGPDNLLGRHTNVKCGKIFSHHLKKFTTTQEMRRSCDKCSQNQPDFVTMYGCDECDWDLCDACNQNETSRTSTSRTSLKTDSSAVYAALPDDLKKNLKNACKDPKRQVRGILHAQGRDFGAPNIPQGSGANIPKFVLRSDGSQVAISEIARDLLQNALA